MQSSAGGSSYLQAQCAMCRGPDRQVSRKVREVKELKAFAALHDSRLTRLNQHQRTRPRAASAF